MLVEEIILFLEKLMVIRKGIKLLCKDNYKDWIIRFSIVWRMFKLLPISSKDSIGRFMLFVILLSKLRFKEYLKGFLSRTNNTHKKELSFSTSTR